MNERLKERIAEEWAMLDPVDPLRSLLSDVIDALKQKPVGKWTGDCIEWSENPYKFNEGQPIYTTPPQRPWGKPWVSLTDEQREACTQSPFTEDNYEDIEAKLKELNT
jgi:hypothetical protein